MPHASDIPEITGREGAEQVPGKRRITEADLAGITLMRGGHRRPADGLCAMEAAALFAGEPHSDAPDCACSAIGKYVIPVNDALSDEGRQSLKPFLLRIIGSRAGTEVEHKRARYLAWQAITKFAPPALHAEGWKEEAARLAGLGGKPTDINLIAAEYIASAIKSESDLASWVLSVARNVLDENLLLASRGAAVVASEAADIIGWESVLPLALAALDGALKIGEA